MANSVLPKQFYLQDTRKVARQLLGKLLVREQDGKRISGVIVETEAYRGFNDTACHAHKGPTPRCRVMFDEGGFTYVYLTYGIHNMLNIVTEKKLFPSAVLIRAIEPVEGVDLMVKNRKTDDLRSLTSGPAKLTKALRIDRAQNAKDITKRGEVWVEDFMINKQLSIVKTPRIGIDYADPEARGWEWRFFIKGNKFVSR